jgi:MoxR-like ATPase
MGRYTPEKSDIQAIALSVLRHRIITNFNAEADNMSSREVIAKIIETVAY